MTGQRGIEQSLSGSVLLQAPFSASRANQRVRRFEPADYRRVYPLVRWSFYALVFLQGPDIPNRTFPIGLPTIAAFVLLPVMLFQARICFRRPPAAFWWFCAFFAGYLIWSCFAVHSEWKMIILLVQEVLLLWVAFNLMQYENIANNSLIALAASCVFLAYLQFKGIWATPVWDHRYGTRWSVMGQDPNYFAGFLSLGTVALIGFACRHKKTGLWLRIAAGAFAGFILLAIIRTGSRGGTIAVAAGILALMPGGSGIWSKIKNTVVVLFAVGFLVTTIVKSPVLKGRYQRTADEGAMSGREEINPAAWAMIEEKPVFGWGPIDNKYELGKRAVYITERHPEGDRDPHNVFLDVLTSVGFLGGAPYLIGVLLSLVAGWKGRKGPLGAMPLALVFSSVVIGLTINTLVFKIYYCLSGYALASAQRRLSGVPRMAPNRKTPQRRYASRPVMIPLIRNASSGTPPGAQP